MTQPSTPPPPQDGHSGAIAAAAVGLALLAVESNARQDVEDDIALALATFAIVLAASLSAPGVIIATGVQLMSRPQVHDALTHTIATTREKVAARVHSGYAAAAQLALTKATADLAPGYRVPQTLPELDPTIDQILADIDTMFGHAQTDIQNTAIHAFDSVQGPDVDAARRAALHQGVNQARKRLAQRATAAASVAVTSGAADAQQAIFAQYQNSSGGRLGKRWTVTSTTPCGMCEALDGTVVALDTEFDHNATTIDADLRPAWRNLLGPPRHPHCRCQLEIVTLG